MRALLGALAIIGAFSAAASAEPMNLDEASLGDVVAGLEIAPVIGPTDIAIANMIATPVSIENNIDLDSQVGYALALNTNAVVAVLSSNINGMGTAAADLGVTSGVADVAP
jgi:hypothetical protein